MYLKWKSTTTLHLCWMKKALMSMIIQLYWKIKKIKSPCWNWFSCSETCLSGWIDKNLLNLPFRINHNNWFLFSIKLVVLKFLVTKSTHFYSFLLVISHALKDNFGTFLISRQLAVYCCYFSSISILVSFFLYSLYLIIN